MEEGSPSLRLDRVSGILAHRNLDTSVYVRSMKSEVLVVDRVANCQTKILLLLILHVENNLTMRANLRSSITIYSCALYLPTRISKT